VRASGPLTDAIRTAVREHKAAILAELVATNDSRVATPEQATELCELVDIVAAEWPEAERAEALAVALADPDAALICFRALVAMETHEAGANRPPNNPQRTSGDGL
jgi:hypothetical protein